MEDQLDLFIDQFYSKYNPSDIPQGDRRVRLKQKLSQDFDGYVTQMYTKYAPDQIPDVDRLTRLRSKYISAAQPQVDPAMVRLAEDEVIKATNPILQTPGLGDMAIDASRMLQSTVADQLPQTLSTVELGLESEKIKGMEALLANKELLAKNNNAAHIPLIEKALAESRAKAPVIESEIQTQKTEAAQKLAGNVQNLTDVTDATSLMKWVGNSVGQAAGQIPMSALSLGTSSFLMEAAAVYDEQLDLLAEKNGISRAEVIERGLDAPAEGQSLALLAGAMDAVSAGKILSLFRGAAKKELKKSVLKKVVGDMSTEALTEGLQGQLESKGASMGAGTEYNWDWTRFINEAAAGAVGGGGISSVAAIDTSPALQEIKQIEKDLDITSSTGDQAIDKSIDDLVLESAAIVDEEFGKVEEIEGTKLEEEVARTKELEKDQKLKMQRDLAEAQLRQQEAELKLKFETSPVIRNQDPISQSLANQEMESELADVETTIDPKTGKLVMAPKPKVEPVIETVEVPVESKVVAPKAKTPAAKRIAKAKEAVKKMFWIKPLDKTGINFEIVDKQPKSKNVIEPFETMEAAELGRRQLVQENLNFIEEQKSKPKPIKVPKVDLEKVAQKEAEAKEDLRVKLINSIDTALARKPAAALARLDQLVTKAEKAELPEVATQIENERTKLANKIADNAQARAESKAINAKKKSKVLPKAERLALNEKIREEKKLKREALPKNRKVTLGGKEVTLEKAKDILITNIAKAVRKEKGQVAIQKEIDTYKQFRKDNNLKETTDERILKQVESYKVKAGKAIETEGRNKTLEQNKIKKQVKESVEDAAEAEKLGMPVEDYLPIKEDIKEAKRQGISLKEYQDRRTQKEAEAKVTKAKFDEKAALEDFKRTMEGEFGLEEGSIEDVNFVPLAEASKHEVVKYLIKQGISFYPRKEISQEQYIALAPKHQQPVLRNLTKIVNKYKNKQGDTTRYFTLEVPDGQVATYKGPGGLHAPVFNNDSAYIIVLVDSKGVPIGNRVERNVILHEFIHDYTKLMFMRAYSLDSKFRSKMEHSFSKIKKTIKEQTKEALRVLEDPDKELTKNQVELLKAIGSYVMPSGRLKDLAESLQKTLYSSGRISNENLDYLVNDVIYSRQNLYAFTNTDEFLSEIFSDPRTVAFLSSVKMNETIKTGFNKGEQKSALYKWFEDLLDYVKEKFAVTPVENNVLDYAMEVIAEYDVEFTNTELERLEVNEQYLIQSITASSLGEEAPTKTEVKKALNSPIVKKLTNTIWKRKEFKTYNDVLAYVKRVNQRLPEKNQLGEVYAKAIFAEVEKRRDVLDHSKKLRTRIVDYVNDHSNQYTKKQLQDLEDFAAVNLDVLPYKDIRPFMSGYISLAHKQEVDPRAYNVMITYGKSEKIVDAIKEIGDKLSSTGAGIMSEWSNPSTFSTNVAKFNTKIADKFQKFIYGGIMRANAQSSIESHNFYKELTTLAEKSDLRHNNLVRIGIYGSIFSTKSDPANIVEWSKEIVENAEAAVNAAESKIKAKENNTYRGALKSKEIQNELAIAQEILEKVKKKLSMDGILSPKEQAFYDKIRAFATKHEDDFFRNASGVWNNRDLQKRFNYFPTLAQGKTTTTESSDFKNDTLLRTGADNAFEALNESPIASEYANLYAKKVWSNYKRIQPKGYFYDYDALAIGKKWSKNMLYDIYASTELRALNRALANKDLQKALGKDIYKAVLRQLKAITKTGYIQDNEIGEATRKVLDVRDKLYTASLATAGQLILQASSGFVGAAVVAASINPIKATKTFAKAIKAAGEASIKGSKLDKMLEETGLGIQLRDIAFEKYLTPDDYRSFVAKNRAEKWAENATDFALRAGDKFAARAVWFAAFFDAGGTLENPTKEAIIRAERTVGLLQNMSDINFSAPIFKQSTVAKKILLGMFMAYKSFAINAFLSMVSAGPRIFKSKEARKIMTAQVGSALAYHALAVMITKPLYEALANGDDDDEDKEEKRFSATEDILSNTAWDLLVGQWAPSVVDQIARWFFNETAAKKLYQPEFDEFDKYVDSPIFGPNKFDDAYKSMMGPGMREPMNVVKDGLTALSIQSSQDAYFNSLEDEEKLDNAWKDFWESMAILTVGGSTIVPFRGDIKRLIERRKVARHTKNRTDKQSGGSGTINDSEIESDYEFSDFDKDIEEQSIDEFLQENN